MVSGKNESPLKMPLSRVSQVISGLQVELKPSYKYPGPPHGKPVAQKYGLFSINVGLIWGTGADSFGQLGFPGSRGEELMKANDGGTEGGWVA